MFGRFDFKDPFRSEDRPLFLAQLAEGTTKLRAFVSHHARHRIAQTDGIVFE
jgi:hypothetical protein